MIDGYTDIAVVVSDTQKAKKWYVEKLGFKVALEKGHAVVVSPNVKGPASCYTCVGITLHRSSQATPGSVLPRTTSIRPART